MSYRLKARLGVAIAVIYFALSGPALSQPVDEPSIKEEILTIWNEYQAAFIENRIDHIANEIYSAPNYFFTPNGILLSQSSSEAHDIFSATKADLDSSNYQSTITQDMVICILNPTVALLSTKYTRYRIDGSVLSENGGTYVFGLFSDGWKITMATSHSPEKMISCAD